MSPDEEKLVKRKQLKEVLRLIKALLRQPRLVELGYRDQLLRAQREFEAILRSGRDDRERGYRATEDICLALLEMFGHEATRKPE
jgi:hypothetical protein